METIIIYTDGSCLGNPGPGGWAWLALQKKQDLFLNISDNSGGEKYTTNNRMEMKALLKALQFATKKYANNPIKIYSDSNLLVQTINQGWKKKANLDLWEKIDALLPQINYRLIWVKAHHKDPYNIKCDKMAQKAAQTIKQKSSKTC